MLRKKREREREREREKCAGIRESNSIDGKSKNSTGGKGDQEIQTFRQGIKNIIAEAGENRCLAEHSLPFYKFSSVPRTHRRHRSFRLYHIGT